MTFSNEEIKKAIDNLTVRARLLKELWIESYDDVSRQAYEDMHTKVTQRIEELRELQDEQD